MGGKPRLGPSGYSKTPLPKKLGIRPGYEVAMLGAPEYLREGLAELAPSARFVAAQSDNTALVMWFVDSAAELSGDARAVAAAIPDGGMWICWRKKAAAPDNEIGEADVREAGLAQRLVDYKIASIDETWSGLKFAVRRTAR